MLKDKKIGIGDSVLAVCAATAERDIFVELGFGNVTISNISENRVEGESYPFTWSRQNALDITFPAGAFDYCFVSDGLHHCSSPHRALLEMYRVARKGVIVLESRDNTLIKLTSAMNLTPRYEVDAVASNAGSFGGVDNSAIPNYIYRWTEVEFIKTINAYNPTGPHQYGFSYGLNLPVAAPSSLKHWILKASYPLLFVLTKLLQKQCNSFGKLAIKPKIPDQLWPWLELRDDKIVFRCSGQPRHGTSGSKPPDPYTFSALGFNPKGCNID
jgi:hypothetical protein